MSQIMISFREVSTTITSKMELCIPVKLSLVYRSLVLAMLLLAITGYSIADERRLLLITKSNYTPKPLDKNELRRLFLGMDVSRNGELLRPLVNKSSEICYQVFLQSVLSMSQKRYEHTLHSNSYRQGIKSPVIYTDQKELLEDLIKQENTISFLFYYGGEKEKGINIVQEIWISNEP